VAGPEGSGAEGSETPARSAKPPGTGSRVARRGPSLTLGPLALLLWSLLLLVAVGLGWALRGWWPPTPPTGVGPVEPPEPPPDRLDLTPATFADLPGWGVDPLTAALPAFRRSCTKLATLPDDRPLGGAQDGLVAGTAGDWRGVCTALEELLAIQDPAERETTGRTFFETRFQPFTVTNRGDPVGLFTGYYEPTLAGSRSRSERYRVPLYLRPPDLVSVDLGRFREDLAGRRIAGRVEGRDLVPFHDRSEIDAGNLAGRGLELVWVDDPIDAFFLHIQGSGRIELAEGGHLRVGYAGQNGHPYFAIGRELIDRGALTREEVSMQSIRRWLEENPEAASELMHRNPSYVFFRELREEGPVGSQGVVLTPGRSLAVDRAFLPLGIPVWLDATAPAAGIEGLDVPLQRLLVAQDSGGAIRGPVRGDVYWGPGDEAADVAGRMKHEGRLWLLLPRTVAPDAGTRPGHVRTGRPSVGGLGSADQLALLDRIEASIARRAPRQIPCPIPRLVGRALQHLRSIEGALAQPGEILEWVPEACVHTTSSVLFAEISAE